ncbi:argininosuccinate synthase [Bradyrhizobium liaoningense]|nr:argininosuccinate synthase [Bradyrhizobium liaoningense]
MGNCGRTLIVFYDDYHTPLVDLVCCLQGGATVFVPVLNSTKPSIAFAAGAGWDVIELDLRATFCDEVVRRAIKANARYQGGYFLSAALSRPVIAEACVAILADATDAQVIHGFAGNDQVRFEAALLTLNGHLKVRCVSELLGSRTGANQDRYTVSENCWGGSIEAGPLADPWRQPLESWGEAEQGEGGALTSDLVVSFASGVPVALDGMKLGLLEIVDRLNAMGRSIPVDTVEDGWVGLKSRALYREAAAEILIAAHADLERFVSSREQNLFKTQIDNAWSRLVYEGGWFDPHRASLDAYIDDVNAWVSGDVRITVGRHGVRVVGRRSEYALYDEHVAIYRFGQDLGLDLARGLRDQLVATSRIARARRYGG